MSPISQDDNPHMDVAHQTHRVRSQKRGPKPLHLELQTNGLKLKVTGLRCRAQTRNPLSEPEPFADCWGCLRCSGLPLPLEGRACKTALQDFRYSQRSQKDFKGFLLGFARMSGSLSNFFGLCGVFTQGHLHRDWQKGSGLLLHSRTQIPGQPSSPRFKK